MMSENNEQGSRDKRKKTENGLVARFSLRVSPINRCDCIEVEYVGNVNQNSISNLISLTVFNTDVKIFSR
jgi:hypothetical protein